MGRALARRSPGPLSQKSDLDQLPLSISNCQRSKDEFRVVSKLNEEVQLVLTVTIKVLTKSKAGRDSKRSAVPSSFHLCASKQRCYFNRVPSRWSLRSKQGEARSLLKGGFISFFLVFPTQSEAPLTSTMFTSKAFLAVSALSSIALAFGTLVPGELVSHFVRKLTLQRLVWTALELQPLLTNVCHRTSSPIDP